MTGFVVSLQELAELVGITAETMRVHLKAVDGQPAWLIERGDRGREYKIEAAGAVAWWQDKREAEEHSSAERAAQFAQMRLELVGPGAEGDQPLTMSGRQRREELEAGMKEMEFRKRKGELLERADLQHVLMPACVELRRRLMLCPGEFAIVAGIDPTVARPLEGIIARAVDAFVTSLAPIGVAPEETP